ncbi:MAG: flavin reductase family protein [Dechloromonas sp.]|nr:flavin reductase family protein [Dechloromonas sp.]
MIENEDENRSLRNALGRFATGVTIVTAIDPDGHPIGLTVNSFSAVSLNPPLVLWCLDNSSHNLAAFLHASHHVINVLAASQLDLSNRFATWPVDRFAGLRWHPCSGGAPLLHGCCASFEVANEAAHAGGDHTIFVGRVEKFSETPGVPPLLFHGGQYRALIEH